MNRREYSLLPPVVRAETMLGFPAECDIFVRTGMRLCGEVCASPHDFIYIERFLMAHPVPAIQTVDAKPRAQRRGKMTQSK